MKKNLLSKVVVVLLVGIILCNGFIPAASASESPLAELYFYDHEAATASNGYGVGALDTTPYMSETKSEISSAGYNCYAYTNVPAGTSDGSASVIRTLANDAIFFINAHGGKGRVVCVDNSNQITRIAANATNDSANYSLAYNFGSTSNKLKKMKVAYWLACETYGTDSTYGSLNQKSTDLGVDCVITHNAKVWHPYIAYFMYRFAYYADQGYSVETSLSLAKNSTLTKYGYSGDTTSNLYTTVNSYKIDGADSNPGAIKIEPAAFGNI